MTINVALVTSEALILGCDSVASVTKFLVDPFANGFATDADGDHMKDANGNLLVPFSGGEEYVVDTIQGVSKLFKIYDRDNCVAAAVTAGLGTIGGRTIRNLADEFFAVQKSQVEPMKTIETVARRFLKFVREAYVCDREETNVPEEYWPELEFLLGGFDANQQNATLCRISVKGNDFAVVYSPTSDPKTGLAWGGQSEHVERLLNGYDSQIPPAAEQIVTGAFDDYRRELQIIMVDTVQGIAERHEISLTDELDVELPPPPSVKIPWSLAQSPFGFANIPIQDSVNFVSFLVNAQSAMQRFSRGIATVGGRTHIALLRRGGEASVEQLNEPEIIHQFTGFDNV